MSSPTNHSRIPLQGERPEILLQKMKSMQEEDIDWKDGRVWSLVYSANDEHDNLLKEASNQFFSSNYLNPFAFKSLQRMEQDVVHMTIDMLHGDDDAVGVMTTGGTESILLTMFTYRQRAQKLNPNIRKPEVVTAATVHPAFDKAALIFGLTLRKAPVDVDMCAVPAAMEKLVNANTILMVASAPSYAHGVLDPIGEIADIAFRHHLPMHVDACIGGFMLPWVEKLGYALSAWDFREAGVSSISADVHKLGFGAKGASVLAYRSMDLLRNQFVITTDFPGGIYVSPTMMGTRPGGPIASAWAGMKHLGESGYLSIAKSLMDATERLRIGLTSIPGISIVGRPCMNIISYTSKDNKPDIFVIADQLEAKGWLIDRQQFPDSIHLTILPTHIHVIDQYLEDLKVAIAYARAHPEASAKGNAALYGLMARIPFRGMVEKNVLRLMEDMYGGKKSVEGDSDESDETIIKGNPVWVGVASRFLSAWKRWRRFWRIRMK